MKLLRLLAATALVTSFAAGAQAANVKAAAGIVDLSQLNLIVFNTFNASQDVEGKTFVGVNVTGSSFQAGLGAAARPNQGFTDSSLPILTVGGNVSANLNIQDGKNGLTGQNITPVTVLIGGSTANVNVNANNATLLVGGSIGQTNGGNGATIEAGGSLGSNPNPNGTTLIANEGPAWTQTNLTTPIAGELASLHANLTALSTALSGLAVTGAYNGTDPNNATFTALDPNHLGYSVIDITVAQLQNARNLVFNIPQLAGGKFLTTFINVTGLTNGANDSFSANSNLSAYNQYVIWNFGNATDTLHFGTQMNGSVLAPGATISNQSPLEGSVVAQNFNQGGEVHLGTFQGVNPFSSSVPEPSVWALMLVGVGAIGAVMRRSRRPMTAIA